MIDARELPPPWARAKNDSGGAWSEIPGRDHSHRWRCPTRTMAVSLFQMPALRLSAAHHPELLRLTPLAVDAYFANDKLPLAYDLNLSLALINITAAAIVVSPAAVGVQVALMGLSSSMFDVAQCEQCEWVSQGPVGGGGLITVQVGCPLE